YADEVMPLLAKVAKTTETELPPVQMYGWVSYALMANKDESKILQPILDKEELIKPQLVEYQVVIKAAEQCDKNGECWLGQAEGKGQDHRAQGIDDARALRPRQRFGDQGPGRVVRAQRSRGPQRIAERGRLHRRVRQRDRGEEDRRPRERGVGPIDLEQLQ